MFNLFNYEKLGTCLRWLFLVLAVAVLPLFQNCNVNTLKEQETDVAASVVDLPVPIDHHPPPPVVPETIETTFEPLLSDRRYTKALLEDVFGPTASLVEGTGIGRNAVEFGAPCSVYENYNVLNSRGTLVPADPDNAGCVLNPSPAVLGANLVPRATVVRQAMLLKACTNLVLNADALTHALHKISPSEALPQPTAANVRSLFRMFYAESAEPSAEIVQALQTMMDPQHMSAASWQAPIYSVCSSNYWQVL